MSSHTVTVRRPAREVFDLFVRQLGRWWPREFTWSQDVLQEIGIEARVDGLCYEIGPHGFHCDWGRVLTLEPPARLTIAWQISPRREPVPDPARASEVDIRFVASGERKTVVTVDHRNFERHGDGADGYREAMNAEQGWPYILRRYAEIATQ